MHYPIIASDGHRYEHWHLRRWLDSCEPEHRRSPLTNKPMDLSSAKFDKALQGEIFIFLDSKGISKGPNLRELASEAPVCGIYSLR